MSCLHVSSFAYDVCSLVPFLFFSLIFVPFPRPGHTCTHKPAKIRCVVGFGTRTPTPSCGCGLGKRCRHHLRHTANGVSPFVPPIPGFGTLARLFARPLASDLYICLFLGSPPFSLLVHDFHLCRPHLSATRGDALFCCGPSSLAQRGRGRGGGDMIKHW